jgi:hypothetical protein
MADPSDSRSEPYYSQSETVPASYQEFVEAMDPPPPLPDYSQPPCPGDNYMWKPGYWDYSNAGYGWVPGAWVMAPWIGALWTRLLWRLLG